jgi:hypothetical protein
MYRIFEKEKKSMIKLYAQDRILRITHELNALRGLPNVASIAAMAVTEPDRKREERLSSKVLREWPEEKRHTVFEFWDLVAQAEAEELAKEKHESLQTKQTEQVERSAVDDNAENTGESRDDRRSGR